MEEAIFRTIQAAQEKAALALIRDAHHGVTHANCHPHGRSGGTNPINYGWLQAFLPIYERMAEGAEKEELGLFINDHIDDTVACFWQTMANDGEPPGEYTVIHEGKCASGDYDILRHVDVAGYCDCVLHHDFDEHREKVVAMAERWGEWLLSVRWDKRQRETLRMGLPLNSFVAIYELTGDYKWLGFATGLLHFGWGDHVKRETTYENGDVWTTWDSGYPWEKRGGYMGHILDWPWYEGQFAQACIRMWPHVDGPTRSIIHDRILKISLKYVRRMEVPEMLGRFSDIKNTSLHGGMNMLQEDSSWLRSCSPVITPDQWLDLDESLAYRQLRCLYWRSMDGDYESPYFIDEAGDIMAVRHHHPRTPPYDPQLKRDHYGIPDLLYARYLITQDPDDRLLAIWMLHDYVGFCNHSGHIALPKARFSEDWYHDAAGKSRLLAWRFLAGWHLLRAELKT